MQIVIDIDEKIFNKLPEAEFGSNVIEDVLEAVENGIPLDTVRAEIEQIADEEQKHDEKWAMGLRYAVKIIDKYKAESEDKEI